MPTFAFAAFVGLGDNVVSPAPKTSAQNVYLVGGTVNVSNPVNGDALIGGGTVVISGNVEKDVNVVGGNVSILGGSAEDLRVIGGNIAVGKKINGEAMIVGGQIIITSDTQIKGDSYIAGGTINFSGTEEGNLVLSGGDIRVDGTVNGNLKIKGAQKVTFGGQAVVKGMTEYSATTEATIETGAQLANAPVFKKIESNRNTSNKTPAGFMALFGLMYFLKLLAVLAAVYGIWYWLRKDAVSAIEETHSHFWKVLLRGFAVLVLIPVGAVILFITVIGWIPSMVLLAGYVALLTLAAPVSIIISTSLLMRLFKKNHTNFTWYQIIFGLVVLRLVALIPIVGWVVCFAIYLVALGTTAGIIKNKLSA